MEENKNPRLLISFVVDNGCTVSAERLQTLQEEFTAFSAAVATAELEWELIAFNGFDTAVLKSFEGSELSALAPNRFPLLGRATMTAADRLTARVEALKAAGGKVHRPWLFMLSDGFTVDSMEEVTARLDGMERSGELLYLPFKTSPKLSTDRLQYLDRSKHMIEIKAGKLADFFAFVLRMVEQRANLAPETGIKFAKSDFEGWAEL